MLTENFLKSCTVKDFCEKAWEDNPDTKVLNLGSARRDWGKPCKYIGVDIEDGEGVDVVLNLDKEKLPFDTEEFDIVLLDQVVEHLENVPPLLQECQRVLKTGGYLFITTPHLSSLISWTDPTHRQHFVLRSLDFIFWDEKEFYRFPAIEGGFEKVYRELTFGKRQWFAKLLYWMSPRRYEKYYCHVIPARGIRIIGKKSDDPEKG